MLLNLLNFEIDIWGRLRKQTAAAQIRSVRHRRSSTGCDNYARQRRRQAYFSLREFDFELEISRRTLVSREESLRLIKLRQERGVSTMLEVRQAEELVYDATEVIPDLDGRSA